MRGITVTAMKLALVACVTMPLAAAAFSTHSSFTSARSHSHIHISRRRAFTTAPNRASSLVMYDYSRDPPSSPELNAWQVLATTERWISSTLAAADTGAGNPYSRKEVSYVCEPQRDAALIVAGIFRRLKESREEGESHGAAEEARAVDQGGDYNPHTLRQTQVIVIPGNQGLVDSFPVFDGLIESINRARRNARDYVTDAKLEKRDDDHSLTDSEWSVSVNCAHLHPDFGKKTAAETLQEMQDQEASGEAVDLVYEEYQAKKLLARQSPFPTIVIEVRSQSPPDFGDTSPQQKSATAASTEAAPDDPVSSNDVQKLEALFGKSAHMESTQSGDDDFYDAIGYRIGGGEFSAVTPLQMAQQWALDHDPHVSEMSAFTESRTAQVDEAYEFIFTNMAMLCEAKGVVERQYLVLPHFLSAAATSFEKFSKEVDAMISHLPDLKDKVEIVTFHPEHVEATKRSPVPLFVLQWKKN